MWAKIYPLSIQTLSCCKATAHYSQKSDHIIYFSTIYLFIYIFKMEFYVDEKKLSGCVGRKCNDYYYFY
jgi:hypothetical protein